MSESERSGLRLIAGDWTCHVCGRRRPNHKIDVATHTRTLASGVVEQQNVRYCNDTVSCGASAMLHDHTDLALARTRLELDACNEMLDWYQEDSARGPRHFLVGLIGGFVVGFLTPISFFGWSPF